MEGNSIVSNGVLTDIADAINAKLGSSEPMTVQQMAGKIDGGLQKKMTGYIEFSSSSITNRCYNDDETIGDNAFNSCGSITSVSLPNVTIIRDYAFYYCGSITSVSLPKVTSIGIGTFVQCPLSSVDLSSMTVAQVRDGMNNWGLYYPGCVITCSDGTITIE